MDAYFDDEPGYRIRADEFALPEITPRVRRGRGGRPGHQGLGARPAGRGHHGRGPQAHRRRASTLDLAALDIAQPRLSADEPSFDVFWEATRSRRPVELRLPPARATTRPLTRHLAALGRRPLLRALVRRRASTPTAARSGSSGSPGSSGAATAAGPPGSYDVPPGTDVRAVARRLAPDAADRARRSCWCAPGAGRGAAPRRRPRRAPTWPAPTTRTAWDRLRAPAAAPHGRRAARLRPRRLRRGAGRRCATRSSRGCARRVEAGRVSADRRTRAQAARQGPGRPAAAAGALPPRPRRRCALDEAAAGARRRRPSSSRRT